MQKYNKKSKYANFRKKKCFLFAYIKKKSYLCSRFIKMDMSKILKSLFLIVSAGVILTGCVTQKQMTYLREVNEQSADSINKTFHAVSEIVIKPGDALSIYISALDKEAIEPYNLPAVAYSTPNSTSLTTVGQLQSFRVNEQGDVELPVLGKLHVEGLKRDEVAELIKQALATQVVDPLVQVNMVGAKATIMGEVTKPGQVEITNGRLTLLDALAAAGDLTPYGRRDNVLITREQDGKLEFARVNLTSQDLFASPYYYLQQNDVVYVSPNKVRVVNSANASLWLSTVSTLASTATVIVTVLRYSTGK